MKKVLLGFLALSATLSAQGFQYPVTQAPSIMSTPITAPRCLDPYRWLEDDTSAETAAWVEAQNKVTFAYLDKIPYRAQLTTRLKSLFDYAKYSARRRVKRRATTSSRRTTACRTRACSTSRRA